MYPKPVQHSPILKKAPYVSRNTHTNERNFGAFPATQESDRSRILSPTSNSRQESQRECREVRPLSPEGNEWKRKQMYKSVPARPPLANNPNHLHPLTG